MKDTIYKDAVAAIDGLGTNFRSNKMKNAPKGSEEFEMFLDDFVREVLKRAFSQKKGDKEIHPRFPPYKNISKFISDLIKECKDLECIMVPTDKTNGYVMMTKDEYISEMEDALAKVTNPISIKNIKAIKLEAEEILESYRHKMSRKEYEGVSQQLALCAIPMPKVFVKDHKPLKESG